MIISIQDNLNNLDISLSQVTKVIEEKTTAYDEFTTFVVVSLAGNETATLKGWTLEKWRKFVKDLKPDAHHC